MIVDGHIHFDSVGHYQRLLADMQRTGARQFCALVIERIGPEPRSFKQADAIWLKLHEPERAFVFGGIDYTGLCRQDDCKVVEVGVASRAAPESPSDFAHQVPLGSRDLLVPD